MDCDLCKQPATCAIESVEADGTSYVCDSHLQSYYSAVRGQGSEVSHWFEPEAIGAELDPRSGLPVVESRAESPEPD